jgi:hypothetical protein
MVSAVYATNCSATVAASVAVTNERVADWIDRNACSRPVRSSAVRSICASSFPKYRSESSNASTVDAEATNTPWLPSGNTNADSTGVSSFGNVPSNADRSGMTTGSDSR